MTLNVKSLIPASESNTVEKYTIPLQIQVLKFLLGFIHNQSTTNSVIVEKNLDTHISFKKQSETSSLNAAATRGPVPVPNDRVAYSI
jgi:hypothetical protein